MEAFRVLKDRYIDGEQKVAAGELVYRQCHWDYGLSDDDTRETGVTHITVTFSPEGSYPGFTIPLRDLERTEPPLRKTVPEQKPGRSKQDYETPPEFLAPVINRFGPLEVDLAATPEKAKAPIFVTPEENSLSVDWVERFEGRNCWLNPPFADIAPWAAKCADFAERAKTGRILFLTPASVGSNWYAEHVHRKGYVISLQGRITFVGATTPYPKDCILSVFGQRINGGEVWKWGGE